MELKQLQALVIDALEDVKAQDIKVFDTTHLTSLFDRLVVVSGTSNRQTKALAASVRDKVKENGGHIVGIEGEDTGEWVLVDLGDMIIHIMQPAIRAYYRLEEIWGDKEVKLGAAKRTSKRTASEPEEEAPKKGRHLTPLDASGPRIDTSEPAEPKARKPRASTAGTAAAKKAPAKKAAAKKTTTAVGKTVKVAVSKTTGAELKALKETKPRAVKTAPVKTVIKRKTAKADE
ncbi:MAG TPA: ribosome silencing factor [Burkholderiaceae bacterium]